MKFTHYLIPVILGETELHYEVVGELSLRDTLDAILNLSDAYITPSNNKISAFYDYAVKYIARPRNYEVEKYGVLTHNQHVFSFGIVIHFINEETGEILDSYLIKETPKKCVAFHLV